MDKEIEDYTIVISDMSPDKIRIIDPKKDVTVQTHNFFVQQTAEQLNLGFMPPAVRSVSSIKVNSYDKSFVVVVEQKPQLMTVQYSDRYCCGRDEVWNDETQEYEDREETVKTMTIAVPWQHWFLYFSRAGSDEDFLLSDAGLYFSKTKIEGVDHKFYTPWLPNTFEPDMGSTSYHQERGFSLPVDDDYSVSLHNVCMDMPHESYKNFQDVWDKLYSGFWYDQTFNSDTWSNLERATEEGDCCEGMEALKADAVDGILESEFFNRVEQPFNYMDYLAWISAHSKVEFDFLQLFEEALDVGKVVEAIKLAPARKVDFSKISHSRLQEQLFRRDEIYYGPDPQYVPLGEDPSGDQHFAVEESAPSVDVSYNPVTVTFDSNAWNTPISTAEWHGRKWQDAEGRWRDWDGRFTTAPIS